MNLHSEKQNKMKRKDLKYLLILSAMIGFLVAIGLLFMSCEKQEDFCWECNIYRYEHEYYLEDQILVERRYLDSVEVCGYTERDIKKYEKFRTLAPYSVNTCGTYIRWQDCLCIKKQE